MQHVFINTSRDSGIANRPQRQLTPMQRALWTSQRLAPGSPLQNMALVSRMHPSADGGSVDGNRLAQAFATVVRANEVLRTRIISSGGADVVSLIPASEIHTEISEQLWVTPEEFSNRIDKRVTLPLDLADRGFDSVIAAHPDGSISWYCNLHHVLTDATSTALVFEQTAAAYQGRVDDASETESDLEYYEWGSGLGTESGRASDHWATRTPPASIGGLYGPLSTGTAATTDPTAATRQPIELSSVTLAALEQRLGSDYKALSPDLSWTAVLLTATATYLHRVAGATELSIGLPVHHRNRRETKALIGPTVEVFPVDITIEPDAGGGAPTLREVHASVVGSLFTTLRHAVCGSAPRAEMQCVVNVIPRATQADFAGFDVTTEWVFPGAVDPSHLLRVQLTRYTAQTEGTSGLSFLVDVNDQAAGPVAKHLGAVIDALATNPDQPIATLDLLTQTERATLTRWGTGQTRASRKLVSVGLLEALAENEGVVLEDDGRSLTGPELRDRVLAMARWVADQGGAGARVAISLGRSAEAVIAIYGCLAAGASFVPIDPAQPAGRQRRLIERAGCRLEIASAKEVWAATEPGRPLLDAPADMAATSEAYLLFTSGSTGEPKGVPISNGGLADYLALAAEAYLNNGKPPVAPLFTALTFDLTITTLFVPILAGGRIVVVAEDGVAGLTKVAARNDLTWLKATPSHLEILTRLLNPAENAIATVIVGGEAFGMPLARRLAASGDLAIFNEYGPTEAVVGCMRYELEPALLADPAQEAVPIGAPAPGVSLLIADRYLQPVPLGASGELLIASDGLTTGYLTSDDDRPAEDAGPFVVVDGVRYYRSGDLVRLQDDERLVYLGRIDEQVKVGGVRLEPTEIERVLDDHPAIARSAVRLWSPTPAEPSLHCVRCGLPDTVPGVAFDADGVCATCHAYERVAPVAASWFKTRDDLAIELAAAATERTGAHDVLHLLSGGKDSTYALYQLVELGARPYVLTLDNGFIAEEAKANVRRSVEDLGLDHEFATTDAMNAIFADSLATYSNVCQGCYKTIYTLATTRAAELGIPIITTGLSRGQLFETRLVPEQFDVDRFDPDAIDRAVIEARKLYHQVDDASRRLLDTTVFDDSLNGGGSVFDRVRYLDVYRYLDVELADMFRFLDDRAPWVRPVDTGRSTNCLINAAGIHTHQTEQGYHNYAVPYAWDVRLGHKTRDEAIEELDDDLDLVDVAAMLAEVGYEPRARSVLTAWYVPAAGAGAEPALDPGRLRAAVAEQLPAYAVPAAFVAVDALPLNANGKLDVGALPAPDRVHRSTASVHVAPTTPEEQAIVSVWEQVLGIEPIGVDDDFFALGGDSLAALEMVIAVGQRLGRHLPEDVAFRYTTPRLMAATIGEAPSAADLSGGVLDPVGTLPLDEVPPLSAGQQAILFDQATRPDDVMYNIGRTYRFAPGTAPDVASLEQALQAVVERHEPLSFAYGSTRRRLCGREALAFSIASPVDADGVEAALAEPHRRPFDLVDGPLLRCRVQPVDDGSTVVLLALHHVSADADSFAIIWDETLALLRGDELPPLEADYASLTTWQQQTEPADRAYFLSAPAAPTPAFATVASADGAPVDEGDGFLLRQTSLNPAGLSRAGAPPLATILTALGSTLAGYLTSATIPIGVITSTRNHAAARDLVGYFLNTVPIVVSRADSVADVASQLGSAMPHRAYPLARILADRRAAGLPADAPSILIAFDDLSDLPGSLQQRVLSNGCAVADATFFVERRGDTLDLSLEHRGTTIDSAAAARLLDGFETALAATVEGTQAATAAGSVLVGPALVDDELILDRIARWEGPEPAVIVNPHEPGAALTWSELSAQADRLASKLQAAGVSGGEPVVVRVGRSPQLIVAVLGVLRAGGAYVPVDVGYPPERVEAMVAKLTGALATRFTVTGDGAEPVTGTAAIDVQQPDSAELLAAPMVSADQRAYVLFTSGSTGVPKPVAVTNGQLSASTNARLQHYGGAAEAGPGFLVVSSPSFDSSIAGIFWALATGGTVILPDDITVHDPAALADMLASDTVTDTLMVPTLYAAVLDQAEAELVPPSPWPGRVIVAGEACPPALVERHNGLFPGTELVNEYGPTEATVWATVDRLLPSETVTIGTPIPGTWVAVVDDDGVVRPEGVAGELVIGGPGVTDGAASTLAGFDGRVFLTGDRAVVQNGKARFLGRVDNQLNVGGARVEPEEIEATLGHLAGVTAVIVVAADVRPVDAILADLGPEQARQLLHAAAASDDPAAALAGALRSEGPRQQLIAHLESATAVDAAPALAALPAAVRPSRVEMHELLPRTANGKLDREAARRLPVSALARPARAEQAPSSATVTRLAQCFGDVLGHAGFGADDSFFDHGGHSLIAVELTMAIEAEFGSTVSVADLYRHPTPAALAAISGLAPPASAAVSNPVLPADTLTVPIQPEGSRIPLFAIHVLGIDCAYFRPLADRLGPDQPLWGLGQPTNDSDLRLTGPTTVQDVAASYVAEIERMVPEGPVLLCAISLGGVVAFETALQLVEAGRHVPMLALFDAIGPEAVAFKLGLKGHARAHVGALREDPVEYVVGRARYQRKKLWRRIELADHKARSRLGLDASHRLEVRQFIEKNVQSQLNYEFRPCAAPLVVFKAADDPFTEHYLSLNMGWDPVADGGLTIQVVPGDHLSMMAQPHVATLANHLTPYLTEADG